MKLYILLFCTVAFSFTPTNTWSQKAKIQITKNQLVSVDDIFDLIKSQTDYTFFYRENLFENVPKIYLKKQRISISQLLEKAFALNDYNFNVDNKRIYINKNNQANLNVNQQQTIYGKVTDEADNPMVGVNILIKGTLRGTQTDLDGAYKIKAAKGDTLIYTFLGYEKQEIIVENQAIINITLKESKLVLDEIVISTGYEKIPIELAAGSYQQINTNKLDIKINQDILSKIEGEVSGVTFENGQAIVRGKSTFGNDISPLIVVDGFPVEDATTINPNDVATVDVLKDAAAASIWGVRSGNGVIVITTKKGKKNTKPSFTFSNNLSITPLYKTKKLPYANTESFLEFEKHLVDNNWVQPIAPPFRSAPYSLGVTTYLDLKSGNITQEEADATINELKRIDSRTEFDNLFRSAPIWIQQNLSFRGGGENHTYRTSLSFNQNLNNGTSIGNSENEIILNLNNSLKISNKLNFNYGINYVKAFAKNNGISGYGLQLYQKTLDENGNYIPQPRGLIQRYKDDLVASGYPYNWDYNVKQEFDNADNTVNSSSLRLAAMLEYDITDYLSATGSFQYESSDARNRSYYNEETYRVRNLINTYTIQSNGEIISQLPEGGIITYGNFNSTSEQGRLQLNFNDVYGKHRVSALAGMEIRANKRLRTSFTKYGYDPNSLLSSDISYGTRYRVTPFGFRSVSDPSSIFKEHNRFLSYYGNISYTYDKKYTITGSTRLDDTNLYGASTKYKNVPLYSLGAKWNVLNEDFFKSKTISRLSLRATYGSNGNVRRNTTGFLTAGFANNPQTNLNYAYITSAKNPLLRLEKVFITNFGVDFGLFNNRISGAVDYYNKKSIDLLSTVAIESIKGFDSSLLNVGEMENKGIDVTLNADVVDNKNFNYSTSLNFSFNKNKVLKSEVPNRVVGTYLSGITPLEGKPLNYLYSYNYNGLDANGNPTALNENNQVVDFEGNVLDENGDVVSEESIQNTEALVYNGTTSPRYYGSWINNFKLGNFFLRSLITYKLGHKFRYNNILFYPSLTTNTPGITNIHKDYEVRWQNPGDELTTTVPRLPENRVEANFVGYNFYAQGNQFVDSASHIRFSELVFGYNFPSKTFKDIGIDGLGLSFQARNIGVIDFNKWNVDPENQVVPLRPTYTFNVTLNF